MSAGIIKCYSPTILEFDTLESMLEEWLQFQFGDMQDFELVFTVFERGKKGRGF